MFSDPFLWSWRLRKNLFEVILKTLGWRQIRGGPLLLFGTYPVSDLINFYGPANLISLAQFLMF